ncbi:hypothetical protein [Sulfuricystis multivorans]|uniref:hypothetical protein n=1 Tax=Sulfuricystis multivorans TaxID=2211108 RepID=UPI000F828D33|nr:hypothetical protein [Sulfuricystis multivorans]
MKKLAAILLGWAASALAQGVPPAPPRAPWLDEAPPRMLREPSAEQAQRWQQWRDERHREHREAWREMSPEERRALRHDIREAGRMYRRGPR